MGKFECFNWGKVKVSGAEISMEFGSYSIQLNALGSNPMFSFTNLIVLGLKEFQYIFCAFCAQNPFINAENSNIDFGRVFWSLWLISFETSSTQKSRCDLDIREKLRKYRIGKKSIVN